LFIFPKALETAWRLLSKRKWVSNIPNWELLVFGIAMGILNYYYHHEVFRHYTIGRCHQINLQTDFQQIMGEGLKYINI